MSWFHGRKREVDAELLAAYADGELEGRAELAALRRRIEDWLDSHPEARCEILAYRQLRELCEAAAPAEPTEPAWESLLERIRVAGSRGAESATARARALGAAGLGGAAAAALLAWALVVPRDQRAAIENGVALQPAAQDVERFPVAVAAEIEILSVTGDADSGLVVGELPLRGPLRLAAPGEISLTSVQPAATDNMLPVLRDDGPPMIWSRLDTEP